MRILLDTHAFLWFVLGDSKLSQAARTAIETTPGDKLISPASYWEIAIKISLGKYTLPLRFEEFVEKGIDDNGFEILPILPGHAAAVAALPFHHRDPFDRMLIGQAVAEKISVVTCDAIFDQYPINCVW